MRQETADQGGRVQLQRQVHAKSEDQRGDAQHLHDDGDGGARAEEDVSDGLAAHEALDERLHDRGLGRGQNDARVAGGGLAELKSLGQDDDGEADGDGGGDDAQELHLLLGGGRRAEPVAGLEVRDGLAGNRERGADHARDGHDEEHAGGAGEAEAEQDDGGNDDGQHGHAGDGIAGCGGDGVGGDGGEEEREDQSQGEAGQR